MLEGYRRDEIYPFLNQKGETVFIDTFLPVRFLVQATITQDAQPRPAYCITVQVGKDIIPAALGVCEWIRYSTLDLQDLQKAFGVIGGPRERGNDWHRLVEEQQLPEQGKTYDSLKHYEDEKDWEQTEIQAKYGDPEAQFQVEVASDGFSTREQFFRYVTPRIQKVFEDLTPTPYEQQQARDRALMQSIMEELDEAWPNRPDPW